MLFEKGVLTVMVRIDDTIDDNNKDAWDASIRIRTNITKRPMQFLLRWSILHDSWGLKAIALAPRSFMIESISIFSSFY